MLRSLLTTWETWSARETLALALGDVSTDQAHDALSRCLSDMPEVDPLDALRDARELVALLQGWQWQTVYAARREGASWAAVATATGVPPEQARVDFAAAVERQEQYGFTDTSAYREVL